ncbi:MAG: hypothetical protein HY395_01835 [Candidatus Doudnabacteria bacterium]|nr:hypothetical protein [Candidatus Doudnabacteria bacterium]
MDKLVWIEELIRSLVKGHRLMDPSAWAPPNPFLLDPLIEDLWLAKIKQAKDIVKERGITFRQIADAIMGPACVRKEFRWAIWGAKLRQLPLDYLLELITFYKDILETRAKADPFALNSAYWHTEDQIESIVDKTAWQEATPEARKVIGQISANCPPLAWGLHTDFFYHRAYEVYGLYKLDDGNVLMIRQFGLFRAPDIWPHSASFPVSTVIIYGIYHDLHCDFDYINHFTTVDNIPQKLKLYNVVIDGKAVNDPKELDVVNNAIIEMAMTQDKHLKALDNEGQKRLTVLSKYYALKEFFELAGMPWYPEDEVFKRFTNRPLLNVKFSKLEESEREKFWRNLFDPYEKDTAAFYPRL